MPTGCSGLCMGREDKASDLAALLDQSGPLGREKGTHEAGEIPWIIGFVVTKEQNGDKLLLLSGPEGGTDSQPHTDTTPLDYAIGKESVETAESKAEEKSAKNSGKRLPEAGQRAGLRGRARQESILGRRHQVKTQTHAKAPSLTVPLSSGPPRTQTFCRQTTPVPFQPNSPGLIHKVHTLIFADNTLPPIPLGRRHEEKGGRELGHPKSPPLRCRHPPAGDKKSRRKKGEGRK
ncbi:hypothetical protein JEQ12_015047 [Ovis aries]|uniref:Uncharacterized protein n=1 Tax=Ovis aries TaxID=9940 RepID=A0A836D4S1_SHEEP|nr:hypothetical protein JEQ12_015047 [Ovis aries]